MSEKKLEEWQRAKFRAHYLLTGKALEAGEIAGVGEKNSYYLAAHFRKDPDFLADRRALYDDYLIEAITARQETMRLAKARAAADSADVYEDQGVVIDKRTDWANIVIQSERSAHFLAKMLTPDVTNRPEASGPVVVVNLTGTATVETNTDEVKPDGE